MLEFAATLLSEAIPMVKAWAMEDTTQSWQKLVEETDKLKSLAGGMTDGTLWSAGLTNGTSKSYTVKKFDETLIKVDGDAVESVTQLVIQVAA